MRRVCLLLACSMLLPSLHAQTPDRTSQLQEIARVASIMIDGDVCQKIVTPRALDHMLHPNPRDEWAGGDNYDVDTDAFNIVKKSTMRLALLADYPVDVNLWMPVPSHLPRIQVVIRNHYDLSQFWNGELDQPMPAEMQTVLSTGRTLTIRRTPEMISVLAPVRNSSGHIVGVAEVVTSMMSPTHDEQ